MRIVLCEEDTRPRLYYFINEGTKEEVGECFFMGDIEKRIKSAKSFGCVVVNEKDYVR